MLTLQFVLYGDKQSKALFYSLTWYVYFIVSEQLPALLILVLTSPWKPKRGPERRELIATDAKN
jgi:hypothetical protein